MCTPWKRLLKNGWSSARQSNQKFAENVLSNLNSEIVTDKRVGSIKLLKVDMWMTDLLDRFRTFGQLPNLIWELTECSSV